MANKDGLEPNKPVDFETLQRVKRAQREAQKNAKAEPKGNTQRRASGVEDVCEAGEPSVQSVLPTAKTKRSKGS